MYLIEHKENPIFVLLAHKITTTLILHLILCYSKRYLSVAMVSKAHYSGRKKSGKIGLHVVEQKPW